MANRIKRFEREVQTVRKQAEIRKALRQARQKLTVKSAARKSAREALLLRMECRVKSVIPRGYQYVFPCGLEAGPLLEAFASFRALRILFTEDLRYLDRVIVLSMRLPFARPLAQWKPPRSRCPHKILRSLLLHLFVRYEMSRPLLRYMVESVIQPLWINHTGFELDMFCHLAEGKHLRTLSTLPGKVTKKMGHFVLTAPETVPVEALLNFAYLRSMGFESHWVNRFFGFRLPLGIDWRLDKMTAFLHFAKKYPEMEMKVLVKLLSFYTTQMEGDYRVYHPVSGLSAVVKPLYPDMDLLGITPKAFLRRKQEWDQYVDRVKSSLQVAEFLRSHTAPLTVSHNGMEFSIRQLVKPEELVREGQAMRHCVGSYINYCAHGKGTIWTLRCFGNRRATIELTNAGSIAQVKARFNAFPDPLIMEVVRKWAKQEGLYLKF